MGEGVKHRMTCSGLHFKEKTVCSCESAWRGASAGGGGLVGSRPGRRREAEGQDGVWGLKVYPDLFWGLNSQDIWMVDIWG